jgi:prepilin-type N-terminal cleavage/methylation domain-containing protein
MVAPGVRRLRALARRTQREEGGYSLVELVVTMAILGTVLAGLATLFESGIHSQSDLDSRFQSEIQLNTAVITRRREAHNACSLKAGYTTSSITLNMPQANPPPQPPDTPCTVPIPETWCTVGSGSRYALWRIDNSTTCVTTGGNAKKYADYISTAAVFTSYTPANIPNSMLARLHVHFPISIKANGETSPIYSLDDDIVFRNSSE